MGQRHGAVAHLVNTTLRQLVRGLDAADVVGVWSRIYRMQLGSHGMGAATAIGMSGWATHLLAAIDAAGYFEADVSKGNLFRDALVSTPYTLGPDGCVLPLERPGLGVEVDEDFLAGHPVIEGPGSV